MLVVVLGDGGPAGVDVGQDGGGPEPGSAGEAREQKHGGHSEQRQPGEGDPTPDRAEGGGGGSLARQREHQAGDQDEHAGGIHERGGLTGVGAAHEIEDRRPRWVVSNLDRQQVSDSGSGPGEELQADEGGDERAIGRPGAFEGHGEPPEGGHGQGPPPGRDHPADGGGDDQDGVDREQAQDVALGTPNDGAVQVHAGEPHQPHARAQDDPGDPPVERDAPLGEKAEEYGADQPHDHEGPQDPQGDPADANPQALGVPAVPIGRPLRSDVRVGAHRRRVSPPPGSSISDGCVRKFGHRHRVVNTRARPGLPTARNPTKSTLSQALGTQIAYRWRD